MILGFPLQKYIFPSSRPNKKATIFQPLNRARNTLLNTKRDKTGAKRAEIWWGLKHLLSLCA
jgi:hypothetical protein